VGYFVAGSEIPSPMVSFSSFTLTAKHKKLSCRREAARCFVSVCSQLQHTYSAVLLLLITVASDLLVHKTLLNSVLLSPIVSGGVRPKPSGQTPLGQCTSLVLFDAVSVRSLETVCLTTVKC